VVAIEDAGFEIRDQIGWAFGSGFPKSHDVSKAIDAALGAEREIVQVIPDRWTGKGNSLNFSTDRPQAEVAIKGKPATPEAQQWQGWGTALKPAWEPIVVARKPLDGTVAANVLEHGTGAINVDGCRVEADRDYLDLDVTQGVSTARTSWTPTAHPRTFVPASGRWPANVIHDGSEEITSGLGEAARFFYCAKASKRDREEGLEDAEPVRSSDRVRDDLPGGDNPRNRSNHARVNHHPTVKPTDLMRYLCRLVTPPGGVVLDPFMGSGSTGKAAILEGLGFVGIEREPEYHAIAEARIRHVMPEPPTPPEVSAPPGQLSLW
jgi:site-specific DNA-methyltransferase (adenine-specific)